MNHSPYILAIDEGTSNAKAVAINRDGQILAQASRPLSVNTPHAGWVEQEGADILAQTIIVMEEVLSILGPQGLQGIAISNQRETAIGWERKSKRPIAPAITWQCSRSHEFCTTIKPRETLIQERTGLPVAPLFSASKMRWMLDQYPDGHSRAAQGELCLGTIDSWLLFHLTGGHEFKTDLSNAARTQLLNLADQYWDQEMLELFGIPLAALPEICPSSGLFGYTVPLGSLGVIPAGVPIMAMIGDSHAALFGHGCGQLGLVKATFGTGSSVMAPMNNAKVTLTQLATTVAWHDGQGPTYALEGNIAHTGDAVAFIADLIQLQGDRSSAYNQIPRSVADTMGIYFVPALTGLGAPYWIPNARGSITGLSRGVQPAHLVRAALESIAYQIRDVIDIMRQHPAFTLETLMTDGGPTRNDWLMQFLADLLQTPIARSNIPELSALGAALLGWKAVAALSTAELKSMVPKHEYFYPDPTVNTLMESCYNGWKQAVKTTLPH